MHQAIRISAAIALLLSVGMFAACTNYDPRDYDEDPPTPAVPTTMPTNAPTQAADADRFHVVLTHATADDVTVDVGDSSGLLLAATSGTPGDGASVASGTVVVSNDDPTTLRVTWVGGPCDSANALLIDPSARQLLLVQPECGGDAIANDRILILAFEAPIDASDVTAVIQDGLDTPG